MPEVENETTTLTPEQQAAYQAWLDNGNTGTFNDYLNAQSNTEAESNWATLLSEAAEGEMPLTDMANNQFDEWDEAIEKWRQGNRAWAKKKLKEAERYIKDQIKKMKDDIDEKQKKTEESPTMKAIKELQKALLKLKELAENIGAKIDEVVQFIRKDLPEMITSFIEFLNNLLKEIMRIIADCTSALIVIATRTPNTLANLARPL